MKNAIIWIALIIIIFGGGVWWSRSLQSNNPDVVSRNGIHWHPTLKITIDGENVPIPSGIGLSGGHYPIHTHDDQTDFRETGGESVGKPLHLEFSGIVRSEDLRLGDFFGIWGRTFNSECILDRCVSDGGSLMMLVNGEENIEFEEYMMQDRDEIEIIFESDDNSLDNLDPDLEG